MKDDELVWLAARYRAGEVSPAEQREVLAGPLADAETRRRFRQILRDDLLLSAVLADGQQDWERARQLLAGDDHRLWAQLETRLRQRPSRRFRPTASSGRRSGWLFIAAAALLLGTTAIWFWTDRTTAITSEGLLATPTSYAPGTLLASGDAPARLRFADGSRLDLAPTTRLRIGDDGAGLELLDGALRARVTQAAPAWLYHYLVDDHAITITGTRLGIARETRMPRIEVYAGQVRVSGPRGDQVIVAGERASVDGARPLLPRDGLVGWYPFLQVRDRRSDNRAARAALGPFILTGAVELDDDALLLQEQAAINLGDLDGRLGKLAAAGSCTISCWLRWPQPPSTGSPLNIYLVHSDSRSRIDRPRRQRPFWHLALPGTVTIRADTAHLLTLRIGPTGWSCYFDGDLLGQVPAAEAKDLQPTPLPVLLLTNRWQHTGATSPLPTRILAVAIHATPLAEQAIRRLHAAGPDRFPRDRIPAGSE